MPIEFQLDRSQPDWHKREYIWAPERFESFVDRCFVQIKAELGEDKMTREEMLDALCFGDFEEHKIKTQQMIRSGKVPAYKSSGKKLTVTQ